MKEKQISDEETPVITEKDIEAIVEQKLAFLSVT